MFELPELMTLASQSDTTLLGRTVQSGSLGNTPHKFVWYNRTPDEFARLTAGRRIGRSRVRGRWLTIALDPGYSLVLGECGGRMLFHAPDTRPPDAYHLRLDFMDGSSLTVTTAMWGAMELYEAGAEEDRDYIRGMRPMPLDAAFTFEYFETLIDGLLDGPKRSVKGLLTQEQLIPGLGNAIAQDILFRARLHPRHPLTEVDTVQRRGLYEAIVTTVAKAIELGGRHDETDLHGNPGRYVRLMDKQAAGRPCPECGTTIEKLQYLGGACYVCPHCQV